MTQTTVLPRSGRSRASAASPAAEAGSQKSPSRPGEILPGGEDLLVGEGNDPPSVRSIASATAGACTGFADPDRRGEGVAAIGGLRGDEPRADAPSSSSPWP